MAKEFKEKTIIANLSKVYQKPATKRARSAATILRNIITKETRMENIKFSNKVNELLWSRGKFNAPRKVTIKVIPDKGIARVILPDEKYEPKTEKKDAKKTEGKKEEKKQEETKPITKKTEEKASTEKKETTTQKMKTEEKTS
jgi:ribosomal protein L31E